MNSRINISSRYRRLTPGRIVALVMIAAVAVALGYARSARDGESVAVPAGAHAGQLSLHACHHETEKGSLPADCGTLVVPENRAGPGSRLIALPVTRIRARSAHPAEPIFRLEGGPGLTNMDFPNAGRLNGNHDMVLVGYRGVDGSSVLDCPEVTSALRHSADSLTSASFSARAAAFRSCADRLRGDGVDLAGYTLPQRVDDLEAARRALHYGRVDLLSESAGTRTALIYAWRHPDSIHRSVMIGVNPPGHFLWDPAQTDRQIRHYSQLCSADAGCRARYGDIAGSMRHTDGELPGHWGFLPIKAGNVRTASFFGLMEGSSGPLTAPLTFDAWRAAAQGDASGMWAMSVMADLMFPRAQVWGDVASVGRADFAAANRHFSGDRRGDTAVGEAGNELVWAGGSLTRAWPASPDDGAYSRVRTSRVETLLIGGNVDGSTPAENAARELMPHLPNGHQVVLREFGHTEDFWNVQPQAGTHLVSRFLDTGAVDASRYRHHAIDFTPGVTYTRMAKALADAMIGLAIVTILSLLLMWRRVRTRGRLGRKTGAVVRSLYAAVLGLGGWFAGALVAMTTSRTLPIDAEALVVLSAGVPAGLGIYLGWTDRAWSRSARRAGLALAVAGALAGAWLGFACAESPMAILTAIAGAVAGANLALIVRDIAGARSQERAATTEEVAATA